MRSVAWCCGLDIYLSVSSNVSRFLFISILATIEVLTAFQDNNHPLASSGYTAKHTI